MASVSVLQDTPVCRVWHKKADGTWAVWDRSQSAISDLTELVAGKTYTFLSDSDCIVEGIRLHAGWTTTEWAEVTFVPGQIIDQGWWDFARKRLKETGLWPILVVLGVKEVKVVSELPPSYGSGDFGCTWQSTRTILVRDALVMPASVFPAVLIHEAVHMHQMDVPDPLTGEGIPVDPVKRELAAYMLNQVYHWLAGDGIEVFRPAPNQTAVYPTAVGLQ